MARGRSAAPDAGALQLPSQRLAEAPQGELAGAVDAVAGIADGPRLEPMFMMIAGLRSLGGSRARVSWMGPRR